jgi:hypothetical protein
MPAPRTKRQAARVRLRQDRAAMRVRRLVLLGLVVAVAVVSLTLTAFGSGAPPTPAPNSALDLSLLPSGPPQPKVVAMQGPLRIQLPISQSRVTAVGYHASSTGGLPLQPLGERANNGFATRMFHKVFGGGGKGLRWYQLPGGEGSQTAVLNVGAVPGTDVYAPVDGVVVALSDNVLNGRVYGARIDIQPARAPSLVVSLTHLRPDPALTVGSSLAAGGSKIGSVIDLAGVEQQSLAKHSKDDGNHVALEIHPAASLSLR